MTTREQFSDKVRIFDRKVTGPNKVASIPFSAFTASTTAYITTQKVLNRAARARTFTIVNNLNQGFTSTNNLIPVDSAAGGGNGDTCSIGNLGAGGSIAKTSESNTALASHVDSFMVAVVVGATAPTTGTYDFWLTEVL